MKKLFLSLIITISSSIVFAQYSADLLLMNPSAQSRALGNAGVASVYQGDILGALYLNPASLEYMKENQDQYNVLRGAELGRSFGVYYSKILPELGVDMHFGAIATRFWFEEVQGSFGLMLNYLNYGKVEILDKYGISKGDYTPNDFVVTGAYAFQANENMYFGFDAKYLYSNLLKSGLRSDLDSLDLQAGQGVFFGASYFQKFEDYFNLGVSIDNIDVFGYSYRKGGSNQETIPNIFRAGISGILLDNNQDGYLIKGEYQFSNLLNNLKTSANSLGLEILFQEKFTGRIGYYAENSAMGARSYFTLGAGFSAGPEFVIDVYYIPPFEKGYVINNTFGVALSYSPNN